MKEVIVRHSTEGLQVEIDGELYLSTKNPALVEPIPDPEPIPEPEPVPSPEPDPEPEPPPDFEPEPEPEPPPVHGRAWTVWGAHGNRKIWPDLEPLNPHGAEVGIQAARNEWEGFQIVVKAHAPLTNVRVSAGGFADASGSTVPAPTPYRQHYIEIADTANKRYGKLGPVPDALVPLTHPETGKPTGGRYGGAQFDIAAGAFEAFWFDAYIPDGVPAGFYGATVTVTADNLDPVEIPIRLEVFDFTLASPKKLQGFFQMAENPVRQLHGAQRWTMDERQGLSHKYEEMLHEHGIDNWSPITGFNYGLNRVRITDREGQISVVWTFYDRLVDPYMDGTAYKDGIPARSLFVPYYLPTMRNDGTGWAERVNQHNYNNMDLDRFRQWMRALNTHLIEKGWMDRAYWFYFDEPFLQDWKYEAFLKVAPIVREEAPDLKIMVTDGYYPNRGRDRLLEYVDVWNPVTWQVRKETVEFYRQRETDGKFNKWNQTLGNANPNVALPNLFPEYDMMFQRTWGVMSKNFGFHGLEWWATNFWYDANRGGRLNPWVDPVAHPPFNNPLNKDGSLFYPGTPSRIGGDQENRKDHLPVGSLRMKGLRFAIQDYEYLHMLDELGVEFDIETLHTLDPEKAAQMVQPMNIGRDPVEFPGHENPAWQWWEGDPDQVLKVREQMARLIEQATKQG